MTDQQHPITPPPELVRQWNLNGSGTSEFIATQAARWGADMELDACCDWVGSTWPLGTAKNLRAARRPKPSSLKEQAQRIFVENGTTLDGRMKLDPDDIAIIRRALEALPD